MQPALARASCRLDDGRLGFGLASSLIAVGDAPEKALALTNRGCVNCTTLSSTN